MVRTSGALSGRRWLRDCYSFEEGPQLVKEQLYSLVSEYFGNESTVRAKDADRNVERGKQQLSLYELVELVKSRHFKYRVSVL